MFSHSLLKRFARDDLITFEFLSAHNTERTLVVEFFASRLRCSDRSNVSHSHTHFQWCWAGDWKVLNGDRNDRRRSERQANQNSARDSVVLCCRSCWDRAKQALSSNKKISVLLCFFSARAKKEFSVSKAEKEVSQFRGLFDGEEFVITVDNWPATASRMRRNNWNCVMIVCTVSTLSSSSSSHWKQKYAAVSRDRRETNSEPVFLRFDRVLLRHSPSVILVATLCVRLCGWSVVVCFSLLVSLTGMLKFVLTIYFFRRLPINSSNWHSHRVKFWILSLNFVLCNCESVENE